MSTWCVLLNMFQPGMCHDVGELLVFESGGYRPLVRGSLWI